MSTALYRRYRPDTFESVIGQNHVTDALQSALKSGRIAHAFLFSGPRGCGKTTSARILARSLNCAQGPTPTPCGVCESCVELAQGGPGSLDVVEIDAASNSSVTDTRELREKATLAPARDRYRIFILDEAHMVSTQGFNALLKVVEEPPEHVKFIFATTEPDKVINTIRSRTHHYPFRLVAPNVLVPYLRELVAKEGITVDEGVYPLVVRSGGGSVRDSLSVLDQLIAGADTHISTEQAVALLGYTDAALLERTVEALGANDGAGTFAIIEEVIGAGHEPRRFVEDLLQRLRDLVVCALAGERASDILVEIPEDQLVVMHTQAARWGGPLLSRRADTVESALREMSGATSPRLQLELLMARLLVSDHAASPVPTQAPVSASVPAPQPVTSQPATSHSAAPRPEPVSAAPTEEPVEASPAPRIVDEEFLRTHWSEIGARLQQSGSAFINLLRDTRGADPEEDTTIVYFQEPSSVSQFKAMNGEDKLSQVLSDLSGTTTRAVARWVGERTPKSPAEEPPAPAPEVAPEANLAPEPATEEPSPAPTPTVEAPEDDSGRHRGKPAVDMFLDIVGGSVIEETLVDAPAGNEFSDGGSGDAADLHHGQIDVADGFDWENE